MSLRPGSDSTPLHTSIANGFTQLMASATFSMVNPPARMFFTASVPAPPLLIVTPAAAVIWPLMVSVSAAESTSIRVLALSVIGALMVWLPAMT